MRLVIVWCVVVGAWLVGQAFGAEDFAPGQNPVVDGKDVCRVAAAVAQNYLAVTDEIWEFENRIPKCTEQFAECMSKRREAAAVLYNKAAEYQGLLEITSSICLGVEIDPSRLNPEQELQLAPKVES